MSRRSRLLAAAVLAPLLLAGTAGCTIGEDDEMATPTRTVTASPQVAVPSAVPTGKGKVSTDDVVWAQGNTLHVGRRSVDLPASGVEELVAVPGGVYLVSGGELWFTDLERLKGTGLTGVTGLSPSADGTQLLVTLEKGGKESVHGYDPATGTLAKEAGQAPPRSSTDPREGPGDYVLTVVGKGVQPYHRDTGEQVPMRGLPREFEPRGWTTPTAFHGMQLADGKPTAVVTCDVKAGSCTRLGPVTGDDPVVFGTRTQG